MTQTDNSKDLLENFVLNSLMDIAQTLNVQRVSFWLLQEENSEIHCQVMIDQKKALF